MLFTRQHVGKNIFHDKIQMRLNVTRDGSATAVMNKFQAELQFKCSYFAFCFCG